MAGASTEPYSGLLGAGSFSLSNDSDTRAVHVDDDVVVKIPSELQDRLRIACQRWAETDSRLEPESLLRALLTDVGRAVTTHRGRISPLFNGNGLHSIVVVPIGGMYYVETPLILGDRCVIGHVCDLTEDAIREMGARADRSISAFRFPDDTVWLEDYFAARNDEVIGDEIYATLEAEEGWMPLVAAFLMPTFGPHATTRTFSATQALIAAAWLLSEDPNANLPWILDFDGPRTPHFCEDDGTTLEMINLDGSSQQPGIAQTSTLHFRFAPVDLFEIVSDHRDAPLRRIAACATDDNYSGSALLTACELVYAAGRSSLSARQTALQAASNTMSTVELHPDERLLRDALIRAARM